MVGRFFGRHRQDVSTSCAVVRPPADATGRSGSHSRRRNSRGATGAGARHGGALHERWGVRLRRERRATHARQAPPVRMVLLPFALESVRLWRPVPCSPSLAHGRSEWAGARHAWRGVAVLHSRGCQQFVSRPSDTAARCVDSDARSAWSGTYRGRSVSRVPGLDTDAGSPTPVLCRHGVPSSGDGERSTARFGAMAAPGRHGA